MPRLSFDMSSMAADLFSFLNNEETKRSIYFLGTKQGVLESTIRQFQKNYPEMNKNKLIIENIIIAPDLLTLIILVGAF